MLMYFNYPCCKPFFDLLNSFALKLLLRTYLPSSLNSFWNQTLYNTEIVTKIIKLMSLLYSHFFFTKSTGIVRFYGMNLCVQIIHFERKLKDKFYHKYFCYVCWQFSLYEFVIFMWVFVLF